MKRRRIREIVAAAQADYLGEPTSPDEITLTVRPEADAERRIGIGVLWATITAPTKRDAMQRALAAHGWDRAWPVLDYWARCFLFDKQSLDTLALHYGRRYSREARMAHLREPVALPEEDRRG